MARILAGSFLAEDATAYSLGAGNSLTVAFGTEVGSRVSYGVTAIGSDQLVYVGGAVSGLTGGIRMGDDGNDLGLRVVISGAGSVSGGSTLASAGVAFYAGSASMLNRGVITGVVGVELTLGGSEVSRIVNNGLILGTNYGVLRADVLGEGPSRLVFVNTGRVSGTFASYDSRLGDRLTTDDLTNAGKMRGDVYLGAGADVYTGTFGQVLGSIFAGDGDDVIRPGNFRDVVYGGDGIDTIDFRFSGAVRVDLGTQANNSGAAGGDLYVDFENIVGSGFGNDRITGTVDDNFIAGLGGADLLEGLAGDDTLVGGVGLDTLTGGFGNDVFLLRAPGDGRDVINDFSREAGNTDIIHLRGGFFGGLFDGALAANIFVVSTGNTAFDLDDRFIFRTTDSTLWFDANGSGRKIKPVLIADFAAGVVLSAADFLVV